MASLEQDILLDDNAFNTASADIIELKKRTEELKEKLHSMYENLSTALITPAGEQIELVAEKVIIKPIDNMILVIEHISKTLDEIIGTGYYHDVFIKYEQLNQNIKN